ncbi:16S rRNA (guanine(966)-N(2))-methyltransferase RsmD [Mycoplasmopsis gallinarum]|uniref:16S rRNA (guanine(966)-N(2))-methyltransferase RsmD n=1 Tax=Mycoplasmopsis gallinarum TaxID=29557 RepID=UPI002962031F|nr:16S rRNA (guanine(966)-N(2))-methyltransferase RsmD [Mycoplasmopsis gallinarum]
MKGLFMLRIISGTHRRLTIEQPSSNKTRPTMDRVREAIFNTLRFDLENKIVLDLFAGSGAFGFEAISNGAMKAVLVDNDYEAVNVIKKNQEKLKINNLDIYKTDALTFLKNREGTVYDYIFLDPPYNEYELLNSVLNILKTKKFLSRNGLIILETNNPSKIIIPDGLTIQNQKQYGKVTILYLTLNN